MRLTFGTVRMVFALQTISLEMTCPRNHDIQACITASAQRVVFSSYHPLVTFESFIRVLTACIIVGCCLVTAIVMHAKFVSVVNAAKSPIEQVQQFI